MFKKTQFNDSDDIPQLEFKKILAELIDGIDDDSSSRLSVLLDVKGNNHVSFTELMKLYNRKFGIHQDPYEKKFKEKAVQSLYWHIATEVLDSKRKKGQAIELETLFPQNGCREFQFIDILN